MWQKIRTPVLYFSLGLNTAFLLMLVIFVIPKFFDGDDHRYHKDYHHKKNYKKHDKKKDPGWWFYHHKIGVSDTQWNQLKPDLKSFHQKAYKICQRVNELRGEMFDLIQTPAENEGKISQIRQNISDLKDRRQKLFIDYMKRKKEFLNQKQIEKLFTIMEKFRDCEKHLHFLDDLNQTKDDWNPNEVR